MDPVLAAFPRRPLGLTDARIPIAARMVAVVVTALFGGAAIFFAWVFLPDILADRASRDGVSVPGQVTGNCHTRRGLIRECRLVIDYRPEGKEPRHAAMRIITVGEFGGGGRVEIRHVPGDPATVGTSWGQEALTSRWLTFAGFEALLLALASVGVFVPFSERSRIARVQAMLGQPNPTWVTLGRMWRGAQTYTWTRAGRSHRGRTTLGFGVKPFARGDQVLALVGDDGTALLLDRGLTNVTLTDQERAAIIAAAARP